MPRLDAASQAHLEAFQRFKIKHPHLEEMDRLLSEAIAEHTSYNLLALYGPSGVGKSTVNAGSLIAHELKSRIPRSRQSLLSRHHQKMLGHKPD